MPKKPAPALTPDQAVDRLETLHATATSALRRALERFVTRRTPPSPAARRKFRYPELRLIWSPQGPMPFTRRAWAKFQSAGTYATTVTQPGFFRHYLLEQLRPLVAEYGAVIEVGVSDREIPYPYVFEEGDELVHGDISVAELARYFPTPILAAVGDDVADGAWVFETDRPRPLALFDALRVDFSLQAPPALHRHRLAHDPALDPADQLPALCRSVRAMGARRDGVAGEPL